MAWRVLGWQFLSARGTLSRPVSVDVVTSAKNGRTITSVGLTDFSLEASADRARDPLRKAATDCGPLLQLFPEAAGKASVLRSTRGALPAQNRGPEPLGDRRRPSTISSVWACSALELAP